MAFCNGRIPITKTKVDIDLPIIGDIGKNNVMGCSDPRLSMIPIGYCNRLFDPDNMKICKGYTDILHNPLGAVLKTESCYAPIDTNADSSDFCPVPDAITQANQETEYGVDCEGRRPVNACTYTTDRNICENSYSRGNNGERPWEYCQYTDAYGCDMMGVVLGSRNSCKWVKNM